MSENTKERDSDREPTYEEIEGGETGTDWRDPVMSENTKDIPEISEEEICYACLGPAHIDDDHQHDEEE